MSNLVLLEKNMSQKINATDVTEEEALNAVFLSVQMNLLNSPMNFAVHQKDKQQNQKSYVVK